MDGGSREQLLDVQRQVIILFKSENPTWKLTTTFRSSSSFEGHPLQARHKQNWGRGFILLLLQTAALPGSDAGSDVIKPPSSFVIQNRQTSCSMWCPIYRARHGARSLTVLDDKSTEPGSTFTVLRVPFVVCPFRGADAKSGKIVQEIPRSWYKRASGS